MRSIAAGLVMVAALAPPAAAQVARPLEGLTVILPCAAGETGDCSSVAVYRPLDGDRIVVLANGSWERAEHNGLAISVIDAQALERVQGPDLTRSLQRLAGVAVTRNGGLGSFTGISVRGTGSERVLVLLDGVRLNDPSAPAGGLDFSSVMAGGVERVELLRGPGSLVWGSEALGGVLHLTSRVPDGVVASAEAGGDGQVSGNVAMGGYLSGLSLAGVNLGFVRRDGFSAAAAGSEDDGFSQVSFGARGSAELGPATLFASARYAAGTSDIDGFPAPLYQLADTAEEQQLRQLTTRVGAEMDYGDGGHVLLSLDHAATRRELADPALSPDPYYTARGGTETAQLRLRQPLSHDLALLVGAGRDWNRYADGFARHAATRDSAYAMLGWMPESGLPGSGNDAGLTAGLRVDRQQAFGSAWTFAANGYAGLSERLRVRAAYGEGFKAPSLFQLYSDFGNGALQPERARSYELGLELWPLLPGGRVASLTLFRSNSRDLIDFVVCPPAGTGICANRPFGTYDNIGRARSQGVEAEAGGDIAPGLAMRVAYAFVASSNRQTGQRLARRPRHTATLGLDWQALARLSLGADLRLVSASFDDAANTQRLGSYAVLDLRASHAVADHVELFGRVENALGERYQTTLGYAQQGRTAFVGVRTRL